MCSNILSKYGVPNKLSTYGMYQIRFVLNMLSKYDMFEYVE